jgi:hypothetical protein
MDVSLWQDLPRAPIQPPTMYARRWSPIVMGAIGTILVHVAFVQTIYMGARIFRQKSPDVAQPGQLVSKMNSGSTEDIVLLNLPLESGGRQKLDVASLATIPTMSAQVVSIDIASIESLSLDDTDARSNAKIDGDASEQARLYGIYAGQIQARVERLWERPRSPVSGLAKTSPSKFDEVAFQCQVQVVQDSSGNVQEVLLLRCNGTSEWQRSLVIAIQQASPLPAPPHPGVFNRSIALDFVGLSFGSGNAPDGYERLPTALVQNAIR